MERRKYALQWLLESPPVEEDKVLWTLYNIAMLKAALKCAILPQQGPLERRKYYVRFTLALRIAAGRRRHSLEDTVTYCNA